MTMSSSQSESRKKAIEALRQHQHQWTADQLAQRVLKGDRDALSTAITWCESTLAEHREKAQHVLDSIMPHTGRSFRLGITGVPGVGKSTLIETLGLMWIASGHRVAVLAIDPSSPITQGSILGDKTRMEQLSVHASAYVRPTATANELGGVAARTHEAILLCEAAGYDRIIVETVGVGQSETAVYHMTDCFLLLMLAGAGDQLQGIKRGIMEMCDILAITKAEGDNERAAERAKAEYQNALHLFPEREDSWFPPVVTVSALQHKGMDTLVEVLSQYERWSKERLWDQKRKIQLLYQMEQEWIRQWKQSKMQNPNFVLKFKSLQDAVSRNEISLSSAVQQLVRD
jgi:LAO/AO transport system kinase